MIAAVALLAVLAAVDEPPAAATVWVASDEATAGTAARVTSELRAFDCTVVATPLDAPSHELAAQLLDGARGPEHAVVILRASPAFAEVWWWDQARARPDTELLPAASPSEWTRLDAIRVAEAVRARVVSPTAPAAVTETVTAAAPTPPPAAPPAADAVTQTRVPRGPLPLRVAMGPSVSGHTQGDASSGLAMSVTVGLFPRTAAAANLTIPLDTTIWTSPNGYATTRDFVVAAALERRLLLPAGPGQFEARGTAGVSLHARVNQGYEDQGARPFADTVTSFSAGPTLGAALAYVFRNGFGLVAAGSGAVTFPRDDFRVSTYVLADPGYVHWSVGLMAEVGTRMPSAR